MSETNNEDNTIDKELASAESWARSNPNNLPPQFNGDPEKFLASYKEMRATLTRTQQELASVKKPANEPVNQEKPVQSPDSLKIPDKPVEPSNEEWMKWGGEIISSGDISSDSRAAIKKRFGIPDQIIDTYVDGIRSKQKEMVNQAASVVGSTDELNKIIQWAADNLTDEERVSINSALSKPGWQNVLLGLQVRQNATNPEPKTRVSTTTGVPSVIKPFANSKEMVTAMRDPRYKYDTEYQQFVQSRVRITGVSKDA